MDKIKIIMLVGLLAVSCLGGGFVAWKAGENICRQKIKERDLEIERIKRQGSEVALRALQRNLEMISERRAPLKQESSWRSKNDERRLEVLPKDCEECFEKVKREVVVKDEKRGWWEYRDPDVLDDEPGEMELNPKLFADTSLASSKSEGDLIEQKERPQAIGKRASRQLGRTGVFLAEPETSIKAATGLHDYELEIEYSPLRLEGHKADLAVVVGSRLRMDHHTSELRGDVTAGIEVRW